MKRQLENVYEIVAFKFIGEDLDVSSIPIYELGEVFIAYQRIIHKILLFKNERLRKGAQLRRDERQKVAFRVCETRKGSDIWALAPFVSDPAVVDLLRTLVNTSLIELGKYALKRIVERDQNGQKPRGSQITGAIHAETVTITNHIYNIGNIERIEIHGGSDITSPPVVMTEETRDFVREIQYEFYEGPSQEVSGIVTKLHPNRRIVELKLSPGQYVKVYLSDPDFEAVRYKTYEGDLLTFLGQPQYILGKEDFEEFYAEKLISTQEGSFY